MSVGSPVSLVTQIRDFPTAATGNAYTDAEKAKLAAIEANATADQTGQEIKNAYEGQTDTNAFTDTEKSKLGAIEENATADQTAGEIKNALEGLSGNNRLSYTALRDAPAGGGDGSSYDDSVVDGRLDTLDEIFDRDSWQDLRGTDHVTIGSIAAAAILSSDVDTITFGNSVSTSSTTTVALLVLFRDGLDRKLFRVAVTNSSNNGNYTVSSALDISSFVANVPDGFKVFRLTANVAPAQGATLSAQLQVRDFPAGAAQSGADIADALEALTGERPSLLHRTAGCSGRGRREHGRGWLRC